ncbi:MAG: hypothetical protein AB7T48_00945 [Solirubrobacterales bacterium]
MGDENPEKPTVGERMGVAARAIPRWGPVQKVMLSAAAEWLLPTPSTFYFNAVKMPPPPDSPELPDAEWVRKESHALLGRSEDRRRTIETKGPGLATISAIFVAAVVVALANGWDRSTWPGRILLAAAIFYALVSLLVPIYLVGPLRRQTIRGSELAKAAEHGDPERFLAEKAIEGAAINDHDNLALTNLQHAARKEVWFVWLLLVSWLIFVPLTGVAERPAPPSSEYQRATCQGRCPPGRNGGVTAPITAPPSGTRNR